MRTDLTPFVGKAGELGTAYCLVHIDLRDRMRAEPAFANGIRIVDDHPHNHDHTIRLLNLDSDQLPPGLNGTKALCIRDGVLEFQDDLDT